MPSIAPMNILMNALKVGGQFGHRGIRALPHIEQREMMGDLGPFKGFILGVWSS